MKSILYSERKQTITLSSTFSTLIFLLLLSCYYTNFTVSLASTKEFKGTAIDEEKAKFNSMFSREQFLLLKEYQREIADKSSTKRLQSKTLKMGKDAVSVLTEVMKENKYPDNSRWMATFMLGRIMGHKASDFISKFLRHPHWVLRMAALKTLLALKDARYADNFAQCLKDPSLLVRIQALENIRYLSIDQKAADVWGMLYHKQNYRSINGKLRRTAIIKDVIKTIGELKYEKAKIPLITMLKKILMMIFLTI